MKLRTTRYSAIAVVAALLAIPCAAQQSLSRSTAGILLGVALFTQGRPAEARWWFEQSRSTPRHREDSERYIAAIAGHDRPRTKL